MSEGTYCTSARSKVRLTRRGKIVVVALALAALALFALAYASSVTAADSVGSPTLTKTVTVSAGQTLWQVAAQANPQGDIRDTVDEIVNLNSLVDTAVEPGAKIAVPVY